jgi:serine/threonine protein kinase, bacterial
MPLPLTIGTLLHGRYRIKGVLAQGEFGFIYVAADQKRGEELCTLEEFLPIAVDAETLAQLRTHWQAEIHPLTQLHHPQILRSRVVIADAERLFLVQDDIVASPYREILSERLAQGVTFSEAEVEQFLIDLLPVLTYLHDRGLRHGNLCLDSVLLQEPEQLPVLSTFGLVRTLAVDCRFQSFNPAWSAAWLAAQSRRRTAPDEDLYDLATVALTLLRGQESDPEADPNALSSWRTGINPAFVRVLKRMVLPQPQGRYGSARKVLEALQALREDSSDEPAIAALENDPTLGRFAASTRAPRAPSRLPPRSTPEPQPIATVPGSSKPDFSLPVLVVIFLLLGSLVTWKVMSLFPQPTAAPAPTGTSTAASPSTSPTVLPVPPPPPQISAASASPDRPPEVAAKSAPRTASPSKLPANLRDRAQQLGLQADLLAVLVDDLAALQAQPSQDQRNQLTEGLLNRLANLSATARQGMGTYNRASYDRWFTEAKLAIPRPKVEALADDQFLRLFPEFQGKPVNPRRFGQVWYAIARDQITALRQSPKATP